MIVLTIVISLAVVSFLFLSFMLVFKHSRNDKVKINKKEMKILPAEDKFSDKEASLNDHSKAA